MITNLLASLVIVINPIGYTVTNTFWETAVCWKNLWGFIQPYTNVINVCSAVEENFRNDFVIPHELGHYIYFSKLSQKWRDKYERICIQDWLKQNECWEDFAEIFRKEITLVWQDNFENLILLNKRIIFVNQVILFLYN